jgi:hypothetical protein
MADALSLNPIRDLKYLAHYPDNDHQRHQTRTVADRKIEHSALALKRRLGQCRYIHKQLRLSFLPFVIVIIMLIAAKGIFISA